MASNARCLFFFLLTLSFFLQTHARDSKFFTTLTKNTEESISVSPGQAPTLAPSPSPEPEVVEHGYGLYGQDPYENYQYPPTTKNPTKTHQFDEEFSKQSNSNEFEKAYSNTYFNGNENGYVPEKQGLSDTRFLENGKYFYDVDKDESSFLNKDGNRVNGYVNGNQENQGLSDTRFLENGKYFYDVNNEEKFENENEKENENYEFDSEKQGMSDTRFLENGKYFNYVNNENDSINNQGDEDVGFHNNGNNRYNGNGNGNENGNSEYETQERGGYNYPKKFPKYEYDTMEEYDREQGYINGNDHYVP